SANPMPSRETGFCPVRAASPFTTRWTPPAARLLVRPRRQTAMRTLCREAAPGPEPQLAAAERKNDIMRRKLNRHREVGHERRGRNKRWPGPEGPCLEHPGKEAASWPEQSASAAASSDSTPPTTCDVGGATASSLTKEIADQG